MVTSDGRELRARAVVVNADPFRLRQLVGADSFTPELNAKLDGMRKDGTTMKVGRGGGGGLGGQAASQAGALPACMRSKRATSGT